MAVNRCLIRALDELKKVTFLDQTTKDSITDAIRRAAQAEQVSAEVQAAKSIHILRSYRRDVFIDQVTKAKSDAAFARITNEMDQVAGAERIRTLRRSLEFDKYEDAPHAAISNMMRGEVQSIQGQLYPLWGALVQKYRPWVVDSKLAKTIHAQMRGVDTGSTKARELAALYHKVTGEYLDRLRKAGVYVEKMPHYAPQSHNDGRIASDRTGWANFLENNLDPVHHPDAAATIAHLESRLITRKLDDPKGALISVSRQIKFKTPEAEFEYATRWGDPSFAQSIFASVEALAEKTVLAEHLGPRSTDTVTQILKDLERSATTAMHQAQIDGNKKLARAYDDDLAQVGRANKISQSLSGAMYNPADLNIANYSSAARNWMGAMMLGKVALSIATQDTINSIVQTRFHAGNFAASFGQQIKSGMDLMSKPDALRYAQEMGVWTNALHATGSRYLDIYDTAQAASGLTRQVFSSVQRLAGVHALDRSLRSATMLTMSRSLMRNLADNWGDLTPRYQKVLKANGISEGIWRRLQANAKPFEGMDTLDVRALPGALRTPVQAFLFRELDLTIVHPQHMDRALLTFGAQRGTAAGELAAFFTQFMSWPIAFLRGTVQREWAMGGNGFIGFSSAMVLAGVVTTQLYEYANGNPMFEWDSPALWSKGILRSGLLTPIGEAAIANYEFRNGGIDSPVIGTMFETTSRILGAADDAFIDGQTGTAARKLLQITDDLALPNLWWAEMSVINRAMDYAMWELDPKYMMSRERRLLKEDRQ